MNLNPRTWFNARKSNDIGSSVIVRAGMTMGPYQDYLSGFLPREVNPWFYENLRSSLGILDGAINRMVTMDGIIDVQGGNDKITQLIKNELIADIPVGDLQVGLQAFYTAMGGEQYEQGFSIAEVVYDRRGREVIGLRVGDSKGGLFHRDPQTGQMETWYMPVLPNTYGRRDGTDAIETILRNNGRQINARSIEGAGYTQINPANLIYSVFNPENDNPYGVSLMRGIEFVSQILVRMHNATGQTWDRFGDPIFHVSYKTKNRALKDAPLESRRKKLSDDLASALTAKRLGNSADFTTAVGADDDVNVTIVGGDGQVLEIEMPAAQMVQQVLAKVGLPGWMMGVPGGTAERMADNQAEVVLQESKTRFEARLPSLDSLTKAWLRGRGVTWKEGDWALVQNLPNLRDELKRAQAGFLIAQTQMMDKMGGIAPPAVVPPQNDDPNAAKRAELSAGMFDDPIVRDALRGTLRKAVHQHKSATGETWPISDPQLPKIQKAAVDALQSSWDMLLSDTLRVLKLPSVKAVGEVFVFDAATMLQQMLQLQSGFILANSKSDSAFVQSIFDAWARGIANAADGEDKAGEVEAIVQRTRDQYAAELPASLHNALQKTSVRVYENDIIKALQDGAYNGTNAREVAAQLEKQFGNHDYDWQRLAESEMAAAHAAGNLKSLQEMGQTHYNWLLAPDACSICTAIAEAGPYVVGEGPMPVRDSHPGCFCVINGVIVKP